MKIHLGQESCYNKEEVWKETDCIGWDTRPLIASPLSFYNYSLPPPFYSPPLSVINYSSNPILLPPLRPPVSPFFIFLFPPSLSPADLQLQCGAFTSPKLANETSPTYKSFTR